MAARPQVLFLAIRTLPQDGRQKSSRYFLKSGRFLGACEDISHASVPIDVELSEAPLHCSDAFPHGRSKSPASPPPRMRGSLCIPASTAF